MMRGVRIGRFLVLLMAEVGGLFGFRLLMLHRYIVQWAIFRGTGWSCLLHVIYLGKYHLCCDTAIQPGIVPFGTPPTVHKPPVPYSMPSDSGGARRGVEAS